MNTKVLAILVTFLLLTSVGLAVSPQTSEQTERVIIGFTSHAAVDTDVVRAAGGTVIGGQDVEIVPMLVANVPEKAVDGLERNPHVSFVEPDIRVQALAQQLPWGIERTKADTVHDYPNTGSSATDVAVVDTGIDRDHPDLAANYVDGYDFVNNDPDPSDDNGHGTHVAGTVAAVDDSADVIGMAPDADLYALKVLDSGGG